MTDREMILAFAAQSLRITYTTPALASEALLSNAEMPPIAMVCATPGRQGCRRQLAHRVRRAV